MSFEFNADEVFQMAIEIEQNGRVFYEKACDKIADNEVKAIFRELAQAEVEHAAAFAKMKAALPASDKEQMVWDPDDQLNQYLAMMAGREVFKKTKSVDDYLAEVKNAEDALNLALQFEKDSIVFYLTMKERTAEGHGKDQLNRIIQEELAHHQRLSLELLRIMD